MSTLAAHVEGYLGIRRALGHRLQVHDRLLGDFVAYLAQRGHGRVTVDAAIGWASAPPEASAAQVARRLSVVRGFATYLVAFDPTTEVPPAHLVAPGAGRRTPYVFTAAEITALMSAARQLRPPLRAAGFTALIGLMACTGLRTSEAFRLDRCDLDLVDGLLLVRHSKYGKSRRIPLHPSTVAALARYRRLLAQAAITVPAGRRAPRLHDLRHAFAVATLRDWHADDLDVQASLPALSEYLGHLNPAHTYWYLEAVPELTAELAARLERYLAEPS
jgi:integrase/recombinase XerD